MNYWDWLKGIAHPENNESFFLENTGTSIKRTDAGEIILSPPHPMQIARFMSIIVDETRDDMICCLVKGNEWDMEIQLNQHTYSLLVDGFWELWGE